MRKYYNFETRFRSLKDELSSYLKGAGIYYELSGMPSAWHFEILANVEEANDINKWLDENTITNK